MKPEDSAPVIHAFVERVFRPLADRLAALEKRLAAMPAPAMGPPGEKGDPGERGAPGPAGADGKDADMPALEAKIDEVVAGIARAQEAARKDLARMLAAEVQRVVAEQPKALDGKEGAPGRDGRDGQPGRDGAPGKDGANGADGFALEDFDAIDDGDGFVLRFARGETVKERRMLKMTLADTYRGVWKDGAYKRGAAVTWGGSLFIAQRDTEAKPETGDDWRLAVKRGRDGKDGEAPKPPAKVKL